MTVTFNPSFVDGDTLRTRFVGAMSSMYRAEVPLYGDLIRIVGDVNEKVLQQIKQSKSHSPERLTLERHGAIRLGTPFELQTVKRIFRLLGMHPVGYYDLTIAGLPMHGTCFRPTDVASLDRNPFRVFTTLLRPELLSAKARRLSLELLGKRNIFSDALVELLDILEAQGGRVTDDQAEPFIQEALRTFSWQSVAAATFYQYQALKAEHPILADIASFQTAHINHLTPRTLDISAAQAAMKEAGMAVKSHIEGPPPRKCPILLRQTSFLALEESVALRMTELDRNRGDESEQQNHLVMSSHKARFGEIEQRGAAVTPKGRDLYDTLLIESRRRANGLSQEEADAVAIEIFKRYPDNWTELRRQGLIYCKYRCIDKSSQLPILDEEGDSILEQLIAGGIVEVSPVTYEDFLPLSAAGIFQSNLQSGEQARKAYDTTKPSSNLKGLEEALGQELLDLDHWYACAQQKSLEAVGKELGL